MSRKEVFFIRHAHALHNLAREIAEREVVDEWKVTFPWLAQVDRDEQIPGWSLALLAKLEKTVSADVIKGSTKQRKQKLFAALSGPGMVDPGLSGKGFEQVLAFRSVANDLVRLNHVETVLTSSLRRALQTAQAFNGLVPVIALDELREVSGAFDCERRRSLEDIREEFPDVDTTLCSPGDVIWVKHYRDALEHAVRIRSLLALNTIMNRPEKVIAVVSHGMFLANAIFQNTNIRSSVPPPKWNCQVVATAILKHSDGSFEITPGRLNSAI